jgi:hypothetical protein
MAGGLMFAGQMHGGVASPAWRSLAKCPLA